MARYTGPVCRLCRREGSKLFLKGERCYSSACAMERRPVPPGQHGKNARGGGSDYKRQLREKQKVRTFYGCNEQGFVQIFKRATKQEGMTGSVMLRMLETRLDNIIYRLGFGFSRAQSRQLVTHGHIKVNNSCVTKPGYQVTVGDVVELSDKMKANLLVKSSVESAVARNIPEWLELDRDGYKGTVKALPSREQMPMEFQEQQIVELYNK